MPTVVPARRRLLSGLLSVSLIWSSLAGALAPMPAAAAQPADKSAKAARPKAKGVISKDLWQELHKPAAKTPGWARDVQGQRWVQVIVGSDSADPRMTSLRGDIERLGGTVLVTHSVLKALTVALPLSRLQQLARLPDVVAVSPNRATQATLSQPEQIAGSATSSGGAVRNYSSTTAYSGYDGTGVAIAVLDSGVMKAHRAFLDGAGVSRVKRNVSMLKSTTNPWVWNSLGSNGDSLQPGTSALSAYETSVAADSDVTHDAFGHGTHVAAVAAGRGLLQNTDRAGMAPNANIYDVRVLNGLGIGTVSDALEGIQWVMYHAREYNIKVMNLSLAAASTDSWDVDPLCLAVQAASAMGITVVVAGGNFGLNVSNQKTYGTISSPGHSPAVLTVGAINFKATTARNDDVVTNFSSRGPTRAYILNGDGSRWYDNVIKPDLVAAGNKIVAASATSASPTAPQKNLLATLMPSLQVGSTGATVYGQEQITLSGTSVAAPMVAGAVAVLLQANPGLTPPLVKAILQYTAQPVAGYNMLEQGAGHINVDGAVRLATVLRTDIATAINNGSLVHGSSSLLAAGKSLPGSRSSTVAATTFNWSRIVVVGGNHIATGDKLFNTYQAIWDPKLTWASQFAMRVTPTFWSLSGVAANTFPQNFSSYYTGTENLISGGVTLADGLMGSNSVTAKTGLFTLVPTLSSWLTSGSGQVLGSGIILSEGLILSEGILLSEGLLLSEGMILSEGLIISEGLLLSEGLIVSEIGGNVVGFNTNGATWGE